MTHSNCKTEYCEIISFPSSVREARQPCRLHGRRQRNEELSTYFEREYQLTWAHQQNKCYPSVTLNLHSTECQTHSVCCFEGGVCLLCLQSCPWKLSLALSQLSLADQLKWSKDLARVGKIELHLKGKWFLFTLRESIHSFRKILLWIRKKKAIG